MFNPRRFSVEFRTGITDEKPVEGRKYTLTHSDETGELFLTVALTYAYDKVNSIKTPEVDLILDNAVLTGDLLSRTYGFQEEATEYLAVVSSNWLSEDVYENYRAKDDSKQQAVEFEEKGYAFETILP